MNYVAISFDSYKFYKMKIIISPAKKIKKEAELLFDPTQPVFLEDAKKLAKTLKALSFEELKILLSCNDDIASLNYERYKYMDFEKNIYHALLAYDGIQYQYMSPLIFDERCFAYVEKHLRILSGLYGVLQPLDGIQPYRLEMQAKLKTEYCKNLYDFWGSKVYEELTKDDNLVINLASKEYSKVIEKYLTDKVDFVTCMFADREKETGKLVEKGVYVKMARGEMVRFMAENNIKDIEGIKSFNGLQFSYNAELSNETLLVFVR